VRDCPVCVTAEKKVKPAYTRRECPRCHDRRYVLDQPAPALTTADEL
jgi:hypothetical protein